MSNNRHKIFTKRKGKNKNQKELKDLSDNELVVFKKNSGKYLLGVEVPAIQVEGKLLGYIIPDGILKDRDNHDSAALGRSLGSNIRAGMTLHVEGDVRSRRFILSVTLGHLVSRTILDLASMEDIGRSLKADRHNVGLLNELFDQCTVAAIEDLPSRVGYMMQTEITKVAARLKQ